MFFSFLKFHGNFLYIFEYNTQLLIWFRIRQSILGGCSRWTRWIVPKLTGRWGCWPGRRPAPPPRPRGARTCWTQHAADLAPGHTILHVQITDLLDFSSERTLAICFLFSVHKGNSFNLTFPDKKEPA